MHVDIIPTLEDNYSYLLTNNSKIGCLIDIGEATPVIEFCQKHQIRIDTVLITHHHHDHTGGLDSLLRVFPKAQVISPESVQEKRKIAYLEEPLITLKTPGHTLDHLCYFLKPHLFTGDLLFHLGCGRVFEGDLSMMFDSLKKLLTFDEETLIYPGHEYTYDNCQFLEKIFKGTALEKKYRTIKEALPLDRPTIPTTLKEQMNNNPFLTQQISPYLRALQLQESTSAFELFSLLREKKNHE